MYIAGASKWEREKAYLRNMFKGEIPEEILWRQKAMQCEGVGEGWVAKLQAHCEKMVPDDIFAKAASRFPYDTPVSKEEYFYRDIFESYFAGMVRHITSSLSRPLPPPPPWKQRCSGKPCGQSLRCHVVTQDKFTHVWEGGCRAGGATWKSEKYTRAGLADVSGLSHGLQANSFAAQKNAKSGVAGASL